MEKFEIGEVFTIIDDDESEHEVEVLAELNIEGTEYAAVGFVEDVKDLSAEDDIDIFFLKLDDDGDLEAIETEEEFNAVSQAFEELMDEDGEEE